MRDYSYIVSDVIPTYFSLNWQLFDNELSPCLTQYFVPFTTGPVCGTRTASTLYFHTSGCTVLIKKVEHMYTPCTTKFNSVHLYVHLSTCLSFYPACCVCSVAHCPFHGFYSYVAQIQPIRWSSTIFSSIGQRSRSHGWLDFLLSGQGVSL